MVQQSNADERSWQLRLSALLRQVRELSDGLDPLVGKYELKSSEFLFGLIGREHVINNVAHK